MPRRALSSMNLGFAPVSGSAPNVMGQSPYQGHSPLDSAAHGEAQPRLTSAGRAFTSLGRAVAEYQLGRAVAEPKERYAKLLK